ncbi:MAG: acetylornithine/succinylornithine family transaminase [Ignavibacteriales bacterium]|nr:acetylornithine/succinylornithine family transaminase [Ignavibacteriales bacterium]
MIQNIFNKEKKIFLNTYKRIPIEIAYGEGVNLIDKNGKRYLDFFAGLAVNSLGYANPKIIGAITEQIQKFAHLSNYFITDVQVEFGELLLRYSGMNKLFLTNSGTEAIETAMKIIRKVKGSEKIIYSLSNGFHGRTYGALSITQRQNYRKKFGHFLPNISQIFFNDVDDLRNKIDKNTAAVFLEFLQGEGGIHFISKEFADTLSELRTEHNFIVVSDSIQCGIGRTGKPFSHNYLDFHPDIITVAKSIGGGLPLGAVLVNEDLQNCFEPGNHGTTFGGNPVSCAAGKVVLQEVFENGLMENARSLGQYLAEELNELKNLFPSTIKEIRGKGLMIGVELFEDGQKFVAKLLEKNILINCTNINVLRLLPPLIISKSDADFFLYNFHESLKEFKS